MGVKRTDRKRAVLSFLQTAKTRGGKFPSPAELEAALGPPDIVPAGRRRAAKNRQVPPRAEGFFVPVPILGAIPAGFGEPVEPTELGSIPVNLEALNIKPTSRTFALKVYGDSMIGAQIAHGDLVVVEAREPKIDEIVAALIDGETTLKRFVAKDGQLFLRAENPKYPDLIPLRELTIQGVVRAVIRVCDRVRPL